MSNTEGQTDRHTKGQTTDRQTDRQTDRRTYGWRRRPRAERCVLQAVLGVLARNGFVDPAVCNRPPHDVTAALVCTIRQRSLPDITPAPISSVVCLSVV